MTRALLIAFVAVTIVTFFPKALDGIVKKVGERIIHISRCVDVEGQPCVVLPVKR
jgi:hypothetical protein